MLRIGITGQEGFIGSHLYNYLGLNENFERIPFENEFFLKEKSLQEFVAKCDVVVHLAAMNRHEDPEVIYNTNIELVKKLIAACESTGSKPHILFSSSTQEVNDNLYGKSKKEGRILFSEWAKKNKARFTGLIIPNVFGPFGLPYYNSVVATFCYQLTHGETPQIQDDKTLELIYVNELAEEILNKVLKPSDALIEKYEVPHRHKCNVSGILEILKEFKETYFEKGEIPDIHSSFRLALFNTFRSYIPHKKFPGKLIQHTDNRGTFVEVIRSNSSGQTSFSTTVPGVTRGNHFHTRKVERFAVIRGKARIQLRKIGTSDIIQYELNGEEPSFVDMPVWYTHNITNIGNDLLLTMFWINEPFNPQDPDTYFEVV